METPINHNQDQKPKSKRTYRQLIIGICAVLVLAIVVGLSGIIWANFVNQQAPMDETVQVEPDETKGNQPNKTPESEPQPEPVNPCAADVMSTLVSNFTQSQTATGVEFAVSYYNINEGCTFEQNAEQPLLAASTAKIAIAMLTFETIANGTWSADTWISYNPDSHFEGGAGPLQFDEEFTGATVIELVELMITQSDNIATNMLLSQLGWTVGTQEYIARITNIPSAEPRKNLISAHQHLLLMQHLLNPNTPGHAEILLWMEQASDRTRLAAITNPDGTQPIVSHKIGDYWDESGVYYHDVAYVHGENPYILIVMTKSASGVRDEVYAQITDLGKKIQALHVPIQ